MKSLLRTMTALALLGIVTQPLQAQSSDRVWQEGSVWAISYVDTKPGHFNDYISDLSNVWRKYLEAQKKDGLIISYKMLNISFPRDGEPDLILLVEHKDWAAFDLANAEYSEKIAGRIQGSVQKAQQANINREDLRTLRGSIVAQEIAFRK
ncbi:MAG: hypothetical protein V3U24_01380 [Candidatus Neomarinimicrobiota bacterium]